jgi:hypothetical protein
MTQLRGWTGAQTAIGSCARLSKAHVRDSTDYPAPRGTGTGCQPCR